MERPIALFLFLLINLTAFGQVLEKIKVAEDINPILGQYLTEESLDTFGFHKTSESESSVWFLHDINQDGEKDLLINGKISTVFYTKGDSIRGLPLFRSSPIGGEYWFSEIDTSTSNPVIKIVPRRKAVEHYGSDTLSVVYNQFGFIEATNSHKNHSFENFNMKVLPCFGTCEKYIFNIAKDGTVEYKVSDEHSFVRIKISRNDVDNFFEVLNTLNIHSINQPNLPTDQSTAIIVLTHRYGNSHEFEDYGLSGSFTLRNLYNRVEFILNKYELQ